MSKLRGDLGEDIATHYLQQQRYHIIKRNFHSRYGEIDIVAKAPDGTLVFVEVKAYKSNAISDPRYAINRKKRQCLINTSRFYILRYNITHSDMRFDLITVEKDQVAHHLENVITLCN